MRCPNPRYVWPNGKVIAVPCGKCLACLSNKRHDWSFRLMQEYRASVSAYFVTLTYNEKFVPECGVVKRHLQLYFKRLRKVCSRLRYYAVGEYGSKTGRPHYHAIIFNCDREAIVNAWSLLDKKSGKSVPIGIVHIGKVTEASVSYTLKYIVQSEEEVAEGFNSGFALMSRGYGLGLHYLTDEMLKWHRVNEANCVMKYGQRLRLPRFYKEKIWPNSEWSDWAYRRSVFNKKVLLEAEVREKKEVSDLRSLGYSDVSIEQLRNARLSRIKKKVAYSQTL